MLHESSFNLVNKKNDEKNSWGLGKLNGNQNSDPNSKWIDFVSKVKEPRLGDCKTSFDDGARDILQEVGHWQI